MEDKKTGNLSPRAQEQYLMILLQKLSPDVREAALEVAQWMATECGVEEHVTPAQIQDWIEDVRARNEARKTPASAVILPFRRKP